MKLGLFGVGAAMLVALVGCGGIEGQGWEDEGDVAGTAQELQIENGIVDINGCDEVNGLDEKNGMEEKNGLEERNGLYASMALSNPDNLDNNAPLLATEGGRKTFQYLVKCALDDGDSIVKGGITYYGKIGAGTGWKNGACDSDCQERITACLGAHINTTGNHVNIFIVGDAADFEDVGPTTNLATYPKMEGAFFGNIFKSPPEFYYCNGPDVGVNTVSGRIGSGNASTQYSSAGACTVACGVAGQLAAPYAESGWGSCSAGGKTWGNVLNVWRQ